MSSDEEAVRRPGRNAAQSPVPSDGDKSPLGAGDQMDEDDDADLFGSDGGGSDAGLDNDEYE